MNPGTPVRRLRRIAVGRTRRAREQVAGALAVRRAEAALAPPPASSYATFGSDTVVVPPARIERPSLIRLGCGVVVLEHSWLLASGGPEPTLTIDDGASLNRFVKIVATSQVHLGEGAILGERVYISDVEYLAGHADALPHLRPLSEPAPVHVGAHSLLGVGVVVKPGVTIGDHAYVGASSVVTEDVPAWSLAVGNPARVIRRFGPDDD